MILNGSIIELKSRITASGDVVQTIKLEVHGEFAALHALEGKAIELEITESKA